MPFPDKNSSQAPSEPVSAAGVAAGVAAAALILLFVPFVLAASLFWALRHRTPRRVYLIVAVVTTLAAVFWTFASWEYFRYIFELIVSRITPEKFPDFTPFGSFPYLSVGLYTFSMWGIFGLVGGKVLTSISPKLAHTLHLDDDSDADIGPLFPDEDTRKEVASLVAFPSAKKGARRPKKATGEPFTAHRDREGVGIVPLGVDAHGRPVSLYETDIGVHGQVLGSTGSGKTETLKRVIAGLMDLGWDGTIVDLKEDIGADGLGQWVEAYARTHTVPFQSWAMSFDQYKHYLNPLEGLHPDLALNAIIATQDFEAPHWAAQAKQILGQLLTLMYDAYTVAPDKFPQPTLREVARMLAGNIAENTKSRRAVVEATLVKAGQRTRDDYFSLYNPNATQTQAANGMAARIGRIFESELGRTGLAPGPGRDPLDVIAPGVVYVGLDELGQPDTSATLAALILARFGGVASESKHAEVRRKRFLIVDEAASADHGLLLNLLRRARSAGIALILATQSAKDWDESWGPLVQNINWTLVMRQNDPESSEMVAHLLGKEQVQSSQLSQRVDEHGQASGGSVSYRTSEEYRVQPDQLRALQTGEAVLYVGKRHKLMHPLVKYLRVLQRPTDELPDGVQLETQARKAQKDSSRIGDVWEYPDFTSGTARPEVTDFPFDDTDGSAAPPGPPPPPRRP